VTETLEHPTKVQYHVLEPLSWQYGPLRCVDPTMLLTGSGGGGKSRIAGSKLHFFCKQFPNAQAVVMRKYRETMTSGTIPFLERVVIGDDPDVDHVRSRNSFEYRNGSRLTYIGMDDERGRLKLRSFGIQGGIDIAWMEEAVEFGYEDFNELKSRMRGKAGPFRQIILTTNPDADTHWINVYLIIGAGATVFYSNTDDNPHNPADYRKTLASMTGVRADRMVRGLWVRATGLVYDQWLDDYGQVPAGQEQGNVTERAEYIDDTNLTLLWMVDDGYAGEVDVNTGYFKAGSHPRAILIGQIQADGTLAVFAESYEVKRLSIGHIKEVLGWSYPEPDYAVVDKSAAELKGQLFELGIQVFNGAPVVEESIKVFQNWIAADENGIRRFKVHPRCKHFRSEMHSYRRDPLTEKPIKDFDHGLDAARYGVWTLRNS
jgi:hypothetical protein